MLDSNADVTSHGQLTASSQCKAIDRRNDGFRAVLDFSEKSLTIFRQGEGIFPTQCRQLTYIGAGNKRLFPVSDEYHSANLIIIINVVHCLRQFMKRCLIQRVERLGT